MSSLQPRSNKIRIVLNVSSADLRAATITIYGKKMKNHKFYKTAILS